MKKWSFLLCLLLVNQFVEACQCDELTPLSLSSCRPYEFIFLGKVQEVLPCEKEVQKVVFDCKSVFKGTYVDQLTLEFECGITACSIDFVSGEEWLVYAKKNNAQALVFDFCSHARKLPLKGQVDYQTELRGTSFFQDRQFLADNFEVKKMKQEGLQQKKYEKVDPDLIPVLLGSGLMFMIVGLYIVRKRKIK